MIIDTHCHYNLEPLAADWQNHWQAAQDKGVTASVIVGTSVETSQKAIIQAESDNRLVASVGIHPNYWQRQHTAEKPVTPEMITEQLQKLDALIATHQTAASATNKSKIVAIGETGLDYFRQDKKALAFEQLKQNQQLAFKMQLDLASKYSLPVILHVRDDAVLSDSSTTDSLAEAQNPNATQTPLANAYWDTYSMIKSHILHLGHDNLSEKPTNSLNFILHCVSGPTEYVRAMVELGAYVGVAANVTYKSADHLRSLVQMVPHDKLLLETDAPFLPPHRYRGQICEPWMIAETAAYLFDLVKSDFQQLITNSTTLFPQLAATQS